MYSGPSPHPSGRGILLYHLLQELLYLLEPVLVFFAHEGDGSTIAVGTGCTADAVNVIFCIVRNIIIDDHLNIIDVDSTRHNVGSYENIDTVRS